MIGLIGFHITLYQYEKTILTMQIQGDHFANAPYALLNELVRVHLKITPYPEVHRTFQVQRTWCARRIFKWTLSIKEEK
jgi:hypothetical protein